MRDSQLTIKKGGLHPIAWSLTDLCEEAPIFPLKMNQ